MAKGIRRSPEQLIAEYEKKIAELKAKADASKLSAGSKDIKAIVAQINKVAVGHGLVSKDVLRLVTSVIAPRQPRTVKAGK